MSFSCGIVGLPNVGKSTIFSALTSAKVAAENFPFCTIEPNTGTVPVPDPRLNVLAEMYKSAKLIPNQITFVDIAGLIKGASKGEGLGNQFLGHIRSVDAIIHVVRCFSDENVVHVDGEVNPIRDVETIDMELIFSDLDSIEKFVQRNEKFAKSGDAALKTKLEMAKLIKAHLESEKPARSFVNTGDPAIFADVTANLLTIKPLMFVANVSEDDLDWENSDKDSAVKKLSEYAKTQKASLVSICGKLEAEIAELPKEERQVYLEELGISLSGLDRMTVAGYKLLNLISFFTMGPKEAHAWSAPAGSTAPQCAGKIHSDFEKGFIRAEIIGYQDFIDAGSELKVKENGKLRVEGKEYLMKDGDIVHFRFNV